MRRLICLVLAALMVMPGGIFLTSCGDEPPSGNLPPEINPTPKPEVEEESLIVPDLFDHGRRTVKFKDITYERPDVELLISDFKALADSISSDGARYDEQAARIRQLDEEYENFATMYSYSHLMTSRDRSNEYWCKENSFLSEHSPTLIKAAEDMLVAAARSENAEKFESDVFGEGFIEEYAEGGIYTDKVVELMKREAELEAKYSTLSTANVTIKYKTLTDTYDNIIAFFADAYGTETETYRTALTECGILFDEEYRKICRETFVSLVKVRRKIANELHLNGYLDYAYENIYHDYSQQQLLEYVNDVSKYVVPVFFELEYSVFARYFYSCYGKGEIPEPPSEIELMNDFYGALGRMDDRLCDVYAYMLQNELYDVEDAEVNRFEGAFTTYLDSYDAPFLFISMEGSCSDYTTLAHEFGHFFDSYLNFNDSESLDLGEVSSQGLELLTLIALKEDISDEAYKYLTYLEIREALCAIIYQSFYALFEHYAYSIEYSDISEDSLVEAMKLAARDMGLTKERCAYLFGTEEPDSLDYVMMTHTMMYPSYVQSYATSAAVALELYSMELNDASGLEAYLAIVNRDGDTATFSERLERAGLTSPFEEDYLIELMNSIHYSVRGEYFFKTNDDSAAA